MGDTKDEHEKKCARKRKELQRKGWSEARIEQYLKDWSKYDVSTKTSRRNFYGSF